MRKGYLLTALAAAVLLASSATALAQVTVSAPKTVGEGGDIVITVSAKAYVPAGTTTDVTGTLTIAPNENATGATHESTDLNVQRGLVANLPFGTNTGTAAVMKQVTATIRIGVAQDNDAEDENVVWTNGLAGLGSLGMTATTTGDVAVVTTGATPAATSIKIDDDETQTYVLKQTSPAPGKATEGDPIVVSLSAVPPHQDDTKLLTVNLDRAMPDYSFALTQTDNTAITGTQARLGLSTVSPAGVGNSVNITVTTPPNDKNRVDEDITLTVYSGQAGASQLVDTLAITLTDDHKLPMVKAEFVDEMGMTLDPQPTSVAEGESVMIKVMPVDDKGMAIAANEKLTVELMAAGSSTADSRDYRTSGMLEIGMNAKTSTGMLTLTAEADEDVGEEMLTLDATVTGDMMYSTTGETAMSNGVVMLTIDDETMKQIAPKATDDAYPAITGAIEMGAGEDGLNPGEMVEIMTDDLFTVMDGYTASYGVRVDGDAVSASASDEVVTINAMKAGDSIVYITGTARMGASLEASQTVSNVAELKFPVNVVDKPLMLTIGMPADVMDGNLVERSEPYNIPVHLNRAVTDAEGSVEVTFAQRGGADNAASAADYTINDVTIMAGEDHAYAELMVHEDMEPDAGTNDNMGEQLVIYAMAGDVQSDDLMLTIWDAAVPALPLIAQILLALLMALGGARLYRRRQG